MAETTQSGGGRDIPTSAIADHGMINAQATAARDQEAAHQRDENLRLECLKLAVAHAGSATGYGTVVGGARAFYEFTQGLPSMTIDATTAAQA